MTEQSDPPNAQPITGAGATEVSTYFGAWLDLNQETPRFPLEPSTDGPFQGDLLSMQELMRGLHQCLVAEIYFSGDPILPGTGPGQSDNLAQRNLLLDDSDNPGGPATHLVQHSLALKPSVTSLPPRTQGRPTFFGPRDYSDLLYFDWGGLPREAQVYLYLPTVDTDEILRAWSARQMPHGIAAGGEQTLRISPADVGLVPLPGPLSAPIPALISVAVPTGVTARERYRIVIRQIEGRSRKIRGAVGFDIVVKTPDEIVPGLRRNISVLKHIASRIPGGNRWHPIFERWLSELGDRFRGFGLDPNDVPGSPTGGPRKPCDPDGDPRRPGKRPVPPDSDRFRYCGHVSAVYFDCAGHLEGFEIEFGCNRRRFSCCGQEMGALLRDLLRLRSQVCVYVCPDCSEKVVRIEMIC